MSPEQWAEIERLFDAARALPAAEQARFLDRACSDPFVRRQVDGMLRHADDDTGHMDQVVANAAGAVAQQPPLREPGAGDVLGDRFELLALRGSGGMGRVFRALDRTSRQVVAVKVLVTGADDRGRFEREAELLGSLTHDGIVKVLASGRTDDGARYFAMEWLEGEDLGERLARGAPSMLDSIALALRVARALAEAHARGVVHRDVKPANIFLPGGDLASAKLLDFGIARFGSVRATATGGVIGTPGYMSPEQARGDRHVGPAADLFSLGCVLFECLSGHRPFAGDHPIAVLTRILFEEAPTLADAGVRCGPQLSALVTALLTKRAEDRPASAADVARRLELAAIEAHTWSSPAPATFQTLTTAERSLASLALVDARGTPSERLPPIVELVTSHGGRVETMLDGTLAIAMSGPITLAEHVERAARCALRIRELLPHVAIGVVAGTRTHAESTHAGDVIDRGIALLDEARRHGPAIALDEASAMLLGSKFETQRMASSWLLVSERDAAEHVAQQAASRTSYIGRERELATVAAALDECIGEEVARAVVLIGQPGIGKSRLVEEVLARNGSRFEVWTAYADVMTRGTPLALATRLVHAAAGSYPGQAKDEQERLLRERVARHVPAAAIAHVVKGLEELGHPQRADDGRDAFRALLAAECAAHPTLLVLEDLHWADAATIRLVDSMLRALAKQPLFVLATARPEVDEAHRDLWAGRPLQELRVGELSDRAATRLARSLLGERCDTARIAEVVQRAAGNPLFLEELARASAAGARELPTTVLAAMQGRVQALPAEQRRVLRAASVFGARFSAEGVLSLVGSDAASHTIARLDELAVADVIVERGRGRGGAQYVFRHELVREAAYSMFTDEDRALGHQLAVRWLEASGESDPMLLAFHFQRAGQPARAVVWLERAAEDALAMRDLLAVVHRVDEAVALGASGEALGRMLALAADAHHQRGDLAAAQAAGRRALPLLAPNTPRWFQAMRAAVALGITQMHSS